MSVDHDVGLLLSKLPDGEFFRVLAQELGHRESLSAVRDVLLSLVASGPTLSASIAAVVNRASPAAAVARAQIEIDARQAILDQPLLDAAAVADAVGSRDANRRNPANRLRDRGDVIGLDVGGRYLHPAFQFDHTAASVRPVVAKINRLLDAKGDPWGVASWWVSASGWSQEGISPAQLLHEGDHDEELLAIARDLVED